MSDHSVMKSQFLQQVPLKTLEKIGVFKRTGNVFLYKKSERLMAAVFAVTDSVSSDTLRERIRAGALDLFAGVRDAMSQRGTISTADGSRLALLAVSIAALLEVACRLGEVTEGNYALLRAELSRLGESLSQSQEEGESIIDPRILEDGLAPEKVRRPVARVASAQHRAAAPVVPSSQASAPAAPRPESHLTFKGNASEMMKVISDNIKDRESSVLEIVQKKVKVSIKDVLDEMPTVGEKTVQRTLSSLVASGSLRKVGERRWSRYELAI